MATAKPAPAAAPPIAPAKSRKMLFILLGAVLLLLIAGGGAAWFLLSAKSEATAAPAKEAPTKPPVFMTLEPFTVNLQMEENVGVQQFLQVGISLQVADTGVQDLIKLYLPQVRSRLLLLLSNQKASEILTVEGKKKLAEEVITQLKDVFADKSQKPEVSDVLFTSFVVQ